MRNGRASGGHGKASLDLWHDGNPVLGEAKYDSYGSAIWTGCWFVELLWHENP